MNRKLIALIVGAVMSVSVAVPAALAWEEGTQGCTPGYWKNHPGAWERFSPTQTVGSVFEGASAALADDTLLEALNYTGGSGLLGAERILLRAAVAGLLNAAASGVDYGTSVTVVKRQVSNALLSDNRARILRLAAEIDTANNRGCPL